MEGGGSTNEDKRRSVVMMLTDPEVMSDPQTGVPWSDREIARRCNVSAPLVGQVRKSLTVNIYSDDAQPRTYTTSSGTPLCTTLRALPISVLVPKA